MPNSGESWISQFESYATYSLAITGFFLLPLSLFWGDKTLPVFVLILFITLSLLAVRPRDGLVFPKPYVLSLAFVLWTLITCFWAPTNYGFQSWSIFLISLIGLFSFYIFLKNDLFENSFKIGFHVCAGLLILDEILNTAILRTFRGPTTDTPAYFQGIILLVISTWYVISAMKETHISRRILSFIAVSLAVFYSTDLLSKSALVIGTAAYCITYLCPKWSIRTITIFSTVLILVSPQIVKNLEPQAAINQFKDIRQAYPLLDRLYVFKYIGLEIENKPIIGHGFNSYGSTIETRDSPVVADNILQLQKSIELAEKGLSKTSYSLNLQVWYDLGLVGALLMAIILATCLWPLSNLEKMRFQLSTFMGFFTATYFYANTAFDSHAPWWLLSNGILAMLALKRIKT